jgi:ring-1,2-phenylacetyl-CoA epoxidase subunit PaaE
MAVSLSTSTPRPAGATSLSPAVGHYPDHQPGPHGAGGGAGSRFTLFYGNRDAISIIFLDALAELKDRYLGQVSSCSTCLSDEEGEVELLNGMLEPRHCDEVIAAFVPDVAEVDAFFICGPGSDDGRMRKRRCWTRGCARAHPHRSASPLAAHRPALAAEMADSARPRPARR